MARRRAFVSVSIVILAVVTLSATPAYAVAPVRGGAAGTPPPGGSSQSGHLNSVGIDQPVPEGTTALLPDALSDNSTLDLDTSLAVTDLVSADADRRINTITWDSEADALNIYAFDPSEEFRKSVAETLPADQLWDIVSTERPIRELEKLIETIAQNPAMLPDGLTFVSGKPSPNGGSMEIGVTGASDAVADALNRASRSTPSIDGVPVTFFEDTVPESATRVRSVAPTISGGYMEGPASAGTRACSTGFPVLRYQDSQYNMLNADHCTDQQGVIWTWGYGSHKIGESTFQAPGDTDLELYIEPDSLSTWVFAGDYTDASTVAPIRGYIAPVGGNSVCYSGSRSGLVCSNVLDSGDTYNCVAFLQCYWTRWSNQSSGTPAAGNGDSSGPVVVFALRQSDNTVGAYGVGVISMIPGNSSATCTGDPGSTASNGRKCSSNVGFAPLSRWASSQSTHNLVYTTS